MFHTIEKYKLPAQILLGLIAVSFIGFGASTLTGAGHDYVGKVGEFKVSETDVNNTMRRLQAAGEKQVDKEAVYQGLLQQAYLQQGAKDLGVSASLTDIKKVIVSDPSFQENGQFSESRYQAFLQQNGLTEDALVADLQKQYAIQTMVNLAQSGNMVSDAQAKQMMLLLQAPRQMRSATFASAQYADKVPVDDAKLQAFYTANKSRYALEQAVKFQYVVLSAQALGSKNAVTDAELKEAYAQLPNGASAPKPALETIKPMLVKEIQAKKGAAALQKAKEQLADLAFNNPNDLKAVATKMGLTLQQHEQWLTRKEAAASGMPEALQTALFSDDVLVKKYNSEPVSVSEDSVWVVHASAVRPQHQAPFTEVAAEVRQDYVAAESRKLAIAAAASALKQAQSGNQSGIMWSSSSAVTAEQAARAMPTTDFQQWLKARPAAGKPAYLLMQNTPEPVLVEITAINAPADLTQALPQAKQSLAQTMGNEWMANLLDWLKIAIQLSLAVRK
ncbi:SurA N-terminal domain-containing protein [Snodgrassella sp. CFCC 13594]|uniref:peptidylprolyl isomerase n=1 Tax=Snodgrassella sp. CFCC 13594 TaxID=1775559 RepID=UPI00082D9FBC|nr:SurA N-terminal domain-containing protein [Snodgrassella sp. CFCC 13594]